jgi:16S rRNA G966 N2-methylase RsmD
MTYYSTFASGFDAVVTKALGRELPDVRVISTLDGGILYASGAAPQRIAALRFLSNSFFVLSVSRDLPRRKPLEAMARRIADGQIGALRKLSPQTGRGPFRVVTSDQNRLCHIAPSLLAGVERRVSSVTRAVPLRSKPQQEFWLLVRSEGIGLFLWRATRRRGTHGSLHKGELHPEVAHLLCLMSNPAKRDVFLDPFCGWGAIVVERVRSFPFGSVTAIDLDETKLQVLRERLLRLRSRGVSVLRADAAELPGIGRQSVDVVVTDPPWGEYGSYDVGRLYAAFFSRLAVVLRPKGLVVLLVNRSSALFDAVAASPFSVLDRKDVLLSGRKAAAICLSPRP